MCGGSNVEVLLLLLFNIIGICGVGRGGCPVKRVEHKIEVLQKAIIHEKGKQNQ